MSLITKTCAATLFALGIVTTPAMASTLTLDDAIGFEEGNDPFGGNSGGFIRVEDYVSPGLAKCDEGTEEEDFTAFECVDDDWEDGVADGNYEDAFFLEYTSALSFDWSFDASAVTGIDPEDVLDPKFVAVKSGISGSQGSGYYIFDVTGHVSGSISVESTDSTKSQFNSISHVSFYDTGEDVPPVPLPAAGWMLLAGVGGLAAMRRRRKS